MAGADPFEAPDVTWHPVSPRLATVRRLGAAVPVVVLIVIAVLLAWLIDRAVVAALAALPALGYLWIWWLIGRQVRAWGYAERAEELVMRSGVMWRSITVVPYGRLQYVDVEAGPLARAFGIASVQLHTASASTDARIPGVGATEAARLRDKLTERGQARLAGL